MTLAAPAIHHHISSEATRIGDAVRHALRMELATYPKPGLVTPVDCGAHHDMDHELMSTSLDALGPWFGALAEAGRRDADFARSLRPLGKAAEQQMLAATNGVNTHRGAIFGLGLLAAAAGRCWAARDGADRVEPSHLQASLVQRWGPALDRHRQRQAGAASHGGLAVQRHHVRGAAGEAAVGFPAVFDLGVPALQAARAQGLDPNAAQVQTLFVLLAEVTDTNVLHRGGAAGDAFVRRSARRFLKSGGCTKAGWLERAETVHRDLVAAWLSPGGCADLLTASIFVADLAAGLA